MKSLIPAPYHIDQTHSPTLRIHIAYCSGVFIGSKLRSIGVVVQHDVNKSAIFGAVTIWIPFLVHIVRIKPLRIDPVILQQEMGKLHVVRRAW